MLNKTLIIGNLTKDPELRYTPQGDPVVSLRLASNRRWKSKTKEDKEEVCFITAVVWGKRAENCNQYLKKGSSIRSSGFLQGKLSNKNTVMES